MRVTLKTWNKHTTEARGGDFEMRKVTKRVNKRWDINNTPPETGGSRKSHNVESSFDRSIAKTDFVTTAAIGAWHCMAIW